MRVESEEIGYMQLQRALYSFRALWQHYRQCRHHKRTTANALAFEVNAEANLLALQQELRTHLDTALMDGIQRKEGEVATEFSGMADALAAPIEETLFFYPLIGAINKLANALA